MIPYDLSTSGTRRQGQRRDKNVPSLHGHRFKHQNRKVNNVVIVEQKEEDINAPPQDSSDEGEASIFKAEEYGEASNDSGFDVTIGKPRSSQLVRASTRKKSKIQGPSDIYAFNNVDSLESQLAFTRQERKVEHLDDDEAVLNMSFQVSQSKTHRQSVGYGKKKVTYKNIHEAPLSRQKDQSTVKRTSSATKEGGSGFVRPPTDGLLAECEP